MRCSATAPSAAPNIADSCATYALPWAIPVSQSSYPSWSGCPRRKVLGIVGHPGAHAQFVLLPESNLLPIPDGISDEQAVFVEPLAAAGEILEQLGTVQGRKACVLGDGKLGLLVAQVLRHAGTETIVLGKHKSKMALARRLDLD